MKSYKFIMFLLLLLILMACQNTNDENNQSDQHIDDHIITTSIYPIEYLVSEIAQDYVEVETVIPSGADAHSYEPSTRRMIELADSDAFFFIGEGMESFSETMAETIETEGVPILRLADHTRLFEEFSVSDVDDLSEHDEEHEHEENDDELEEHENEDHIHDEAHDHQDEDDHEEHHEDHQSDDHHNHDHGDFDPHFWLDPIRMTDAGEIILEELIALYPDQQEVFEANFNQFKDKMTELDEQYQQSLGNEVPMLVTHKSFSYLEERYPIKQYSIRGVSSSQEPSQKELQQLFEDIKSLNINHIVLETNSDDRLANTIADELNLNKHYLSNLSTRTEEEVESNKDYYDIMLDNLEVIQQLNE